MLKIEEGKYYKTRDGRKVGPIRKWEGCLKEWAVDGRNGYLEGFNTEDLIAEWTDGPVVTETVTKTRIVPGVYDGVEVVASQSQGVIGVYMARTYTPDELDAAAAVLSALAKGLRDA